MKNKQTKTPTPCNPSILRQVCNFIPNHLVPQLARETKVDQKARSFQPWSQVVSLMFAQLAHSLGLNDVCDSLRLFSGPLSAIRGATPPSRNGLSHANKVRDAVMAERLFWSVLEHLQSLSPGFRGGRKGKGFTFRFKRAIHLVDSTTIQLIASCMDWAKHRRRKAAAKCHLRLDLLACWLGPPETWMDLSLSTTTRVPGCCSLTTPSSPKPPVSGAFTTLSRKTRAIPCFEEKGTISRSPGPTQSPCCPAKPDSLLIACGI